MKKLLIAALAGAVLAPVAIAQIVPSPPMAAQRAHAVKAPFGATRNDEFYWLRDDTRKNPEMLAYLGAENAYADAILAPGKGLADTVFNEIVSHIKQDDSSVPAFEDGYWYYSRYETGASYPIFARRKGTMEAPEEILLDQARLAAGKEFYQVRGVSVTEDGRYMGWGEDLTGRRQNILRFKDLQTGEMLADTITNTESAPVWSDDGKAVYYVDKDPVTLLSTRIKVHMIGTPVAQDRTVYEEKDASFYIGITRTTSDKYICIYMQSTVSSEQRCTSAAKPGAFTTLAPRQRDFEYSADHVAGRWLIRTNWNAKNYRLMTAANGTSSRTGWKALVPASDTVFIENYSGYNGFVAIEERSGGNKRLRILTDAGKSSFVEADEPAYAMSLGGNPEEDTPWVRYTYDSLVTPTTTYETNVQTGERRTLKVQPTPGYDPSKYVTERVWATARDGTKIPVSLVYAKGFRKDGTAAMLQEAYGSYGSSSDPEFSTLNPSLLDRGMVYAIAHIRGGQEMGRAWYDDGHLMHKKNSFTDFIDVTRYLVKEGYAAPGRVAALGGSAGGLLMGAVANMAPQDYGVIVAQVPFVDVVTTMLDASIPLTTNEYDEWGNPADRKFYDYMLSYSPYDNVTAQHYPAIYVGTGLWDSQVQYYEPAKWVARLRARALPGKPLVFRVNMEAGHGGKSGRFERFKQEAEWTAFMLMQLGVVKP